MNNINAVLFDLDGTLLPMDQDEFVKTYFALLAKRMAGYGYDPKVLVDTIWSGTKAMMKNDGTKQNSEVFWNAFVERYGESYRNDQEKFDEYYDNEFLKVREVCGYNPMAAETVRRIKEASLRVVLATQPIFPSVATEHRIRWAGLEVDDFELYTTYENIGFCKPDMGYYKEICNRLGLLPEECLMVGNDVGDDMVAEELGMKVFLLTDCLINQKGEDISRYPNGSFDELLLYLDL